MQSSPKKLKKSPSDFEQFYTPKIPWWDTIETSKIDTLEGFYQDFISCGKVNYTGLKQTLCNMTTAGKNKSKLERKAVDLFKNLFFFPYRADNLSQLASCAAMTSIKTHMGESIIAHGVEESKGGLYNIMMMAVSGQVLAPSGYWGHFIDGAPNISPIQHGPYYIIYSTNGIKTKPWPNNPSFEQIEYILVPFDEVKLKLAQLVDNLINHGMLSGSQGQVFLNKVKCYQALCEVLDLNPAKDVETLANKVHNANTTHQTQGLNMSTSHLLAQKPTTYLPTNKRHREDFFDNDYLKESKHDQGVDKKLNGRPSKKG